MSGEDIEKEHEPTQKRLEDARRQGDVARSADLSTAAAYGGLLAAVVTIGPVLLTGFAQQAASYLDRLADPQALPPTSSVLFARMASLALPFSALILAPAGLVLVALMAQRAIVIAPDRIRPKLSRIDPIANAGHKFGRGGLVEFLKSAVKFALTGLVLAIILSRHGSEIVASQALAAGQVSILLGRMVVEFIGATAAVTGVIAAGDWLWQWFELRRRNRMSRQDLVDEHKQSEGDPHFKQARRQRAHSIATNRMIHDVAKADVVIVNPTHFAVALRWQRRSGRAPICVAKGVDEVAARIRERAAECGVPLRSDPPTARALHAAIDVGGEVRPEHYAPVAAAIRFAEDMRRRARERRG